MRNNLKRYIFGIFVFLGILFIPSGVRALDLKLTYDEQLGRCVSIFFVVPSYDDSGNVDGFLYFSDRSIMKQDLNNKLVYQNEDYRANANITEIDKTNEEGYKVKGETDLLIKNYDENGNILFTKQFGGTGVEIRNLNILFKSYNMKNELDGYLVVFTTLSSDLGIEPGTSMAKLDLNGDIVWIKNINEYLAFDGLFYADNDKSFVFDIDGGTFFKNNFLTGETVFEKDTGIYIADINYSYNKDGVFDGIVVVGFDVNNYGTLIKYNLAGNEIFRIRYDNNDVYSMYYDVISSYMPDGSYDGYIVTAVTSDNKTLLIKYDLNGEKVFEKVYSDKNTFGFGLVDNYDTTGRQNGYLLYASNRDMGVWWPSRKSEIQTYEACDELIVAKYTYDMFPVVKKEDNGGTITVKSGAYPGELVKVKVVVKEGYSLQRIIVKDESGKEIEVNSDGTFVMPEGKVTVSAIYKRVTNPDTVSAAYMVLGVILIASVGSMIVIKKRNDM